MGYVIVNYVKDGDKVAELAGTSFNLRTDKVIAHYDADKEFMGGVIYTGFTGESCCMHTGAVSPYWLNRDMIFLVFDYPFNVLGVKRIFGHVPEDNDHAIAFNRKFGGKIVATIDGVYPGNKACVVMCLEKDACRLINIKPKNFQGWFH